MSELLSQRFIQERIRARRYRLTKHATVARMERGITIEDLEHALLHSTIIERYPKDQPYPACRVLGRLVSGDPLHIVCSRGMQEPALRIVTLYEPDDALWQSNYKIRKVKK